MRLPRRPAGDVAILVALALLVCGAGLGLRGPWPPDEPRFTLLGRDVALSGEWLFPRRGGELYPDKPPLYFWEVAAVYQATGSLRLANQVPSLVAALATLLLVYDLGRRSWNRRVGLWAGLALLAAVQFPLQARSGQIDATVTFWTTLGLYGLARHLLLGPSWGWYAAGGVAAGIGVITKGVGFLPLLALVPFAVGRRLGFRGLLRERGGVRWLVLVPAVLLPVLAWLVPMAVRASGDPALAAYRDEILWRQTAERYADAWHHHKPWWYFAEVIAGLWLPLSALLPWLVPAWWRRLRRGDGRYLLLLGYALLVVVFFSASPGKRGVYVLPALPAVALAAAPLLPGLWRRPAVQRLGFWLLTAVATLLAAGAFFGAAGGVRARYVEHAEIADRLWPGVAALAGVAIVGAVLARPRRGMSALAVFLVVLWLGYGLVAYPVVDADRSSEPFLADVEARLPPGAELAMIGPKEQFLLAADRPVTHFGYLTDPALQVALAARWLRDDPGPGRSRWALVPESWIDDCLDPLEVVDLGVRHRERWSLAPAAAVTGDCPLPPMPDLRPPPPGGYVANPGPASRGGSG